MISNVAKFKVFIGSFFIQASWSFKNMQGLGFVAALSPALGEIYTEKRRRTEALKRHSVYYNAHPYMASPILGAVINLEEQAGKKDVDTGAAVSFKEALMGPYGSIGDGFFWGAIRPVAALAGIIATFFWGLWGPVLFLVLYNFFHILMRWKGLDWGCKYGVKVIERIAALELPMWSIRLRVAGSALLGVLSTLLVLSQLGVLPVAGGAELGAGAGADNAVLFPDALISTVLIVELALIAFALVINIFLVERVALQRLVYAVIVPVLIFGIIIF